MVVIVTDRMEVVMVRQLALARRKDAPNFKPQSVAREPKLSVLHRRKTRWRVLLTRLNRGVCRDRRRHGILCRRRGDNFTTLKVYAVALL